MNEDFNNIKIFTLLTQSQLTLIQTMNEFAQSKTQNMFIQKGEKRNVGFHFALTSFIYEQCNFDEIVYFSLTVRQAKEAYGDFFRFMEERGNKNVKLLRNGGLDGRYKIHFIEGIRKRQVAFEVARFDYPCKSSPPYGSLVIYDDFLHEQVRNVPDNDYYYQGKSIWILPFNTVNNEWVESLGKIDKIIKFIE
jgi:hypothetical protein